MTNFRIVYNHPWLLLLMIPVLLLALLPHFLTEKKYRRTRNRIISLVAFLVASILAVNLLAGISFTYENPNENNELIVLDSLNLTEIKTKAMANVVNALETGKKVLFVLPEKNDVIYRSARNIAGVKTTLVGTLNVYDLLNCDTVVVLKDAVSKIEEVYA